MSHARGQEAVLDGLDPRVEGLGGVIGLDRNRFLSDDGPGVDPLVDEVDRAAGHPDPPRQRLLDRTLTRERGQE
jgi:hypothetical protein